MSAQIGFKLADAPPESDSLTDYDRAQLKLYARLLDADVAKPETLSGAVDGVDIIISALQGGPDVIVAGQEALAEAGKAAGVSRIFPSDFSVDFTGIEDEEHIFLGWRRQGDRAIAEVGLAQTNTFNGAFTEMLLEPFLGLIDWERAEITYWGDPDQLFDFTTTDDVARYVAAAALANEVPQGAFRVIGEAVSPRDLTAIAERIEGQPFSLRHLGSLQDLDAAIAKAQTKEPQNPMAWAELQYHRAMASGAGKIDDPTNDVFPGISAIGVEEFLRAAKQARST